MTRFRHNCAQGQNCWLNRRWNPDALGRAAQEHDGEWPFPRRISPTDIDGFIECYGELLFIETKETGASVPLGQKRALTKLSLKGATVLLQECSPPSEDAVVRTQLCVDGEWYPWEEMDRLGRDRLVQRWFAWVDGKASAA